MPSASIANGDRVVLLEPVSPRPASARPLHPRRLRCRSRRRPRPRSPGAPSCRARRARSPGGPTGARRILASTLFVRSSAVGSGEARWLRTARQGLLAVALACSGTWALAQLRAARFAAWRDRLASVLAGRDSTHRVPPPHRGRTVTRHARRAWGRLDLPARLSALVAEGVDDATLGVAVGTSPARPSREPGNVALAGHRDTVFRILEEVKPEDLLRLVTPTGLSSTASSGWRSSIPPTDVVGRPTRSACSPRDVLSFGYVGRAPLRYVVRARPVESAYATSSIPGRSRRSRTRRSPARPSRGSRFSRSTPRSPCGPCPPRPSRVGGAMISRSRAIASSRSSTIVMQGPRT